MKMILLSIWIVVLSLIYPVDLKDYKSSFNKPMKRYTFSEFYEDKDNFGFYPYHPKRSSIYDDEENLDLYAYHGNSKRSNSKPMKRYTFSEFYEDKDNFGFYPAHPKRSVKDSADEKSLFLKKRSAIAFNSKKFQNITHCQFGSNSSAISCIVSNTPTEKVECEADLNLGESSQFNFSAFGIEISNDKNDSKSFNLYPFKENELTGERIFYNYQIKINNQYIDFRITHESKNESFTGINIKDRSCFNKLHELLEKSAKLKTVDFTISSENALTKILFIGDLIVDGKSKGLENKIMKRHTFSEFYEDKDNFGFYPYHPKRSSNF